MSEAQGVDFSHEQKDRNPSLLHIQPISENPMGTSPKKLVYCPPILGAVPQLDDWQQISEKVKAVNAIDIDLYGYPDMQAYIQQAAEQLQAAGYSSDNTILAGFSEGASLAARIGQRMDLPKEHVYLMAPIFSFGPLIEERRQVLQARKDFNTYGNGDFPIADDNAAEGLLNYLKVYGKRFYESPHKLYSSTGLPLSKLEQAKLWYSKVRTQWASTPDDLEAGTVISGTRDLISPPAEHSALVIDANHRLNDYLDYLAQRI